MNKAKCEIFSDLTFQDLLKMRSVANQTARSTGVSMAGYVSAKIYQPCPGCFLSHAVLSFRAAKNAGQRGSFACFRLTTKNQLVIIRTPAFLAEKHGQVDPPFSFSVTSSVRMNSHNSIDFSWQQRLTEVVMDIHHFDIARLQAGMCQHGLQ